MKISRFREPSGLILTHFGRRHTFDDAMGALNELVEITSGSSEIYDIVIHEDDLEIDLSGNQMVDLRERVKETFRKYQRGALAFVANADFVFGLCRQLELMMGSDSIAVSVFRTEELARKWINEMQSLHNRGNK
jgi:hypothetical protein